MAQAMATVTGEELPGESPHYIRDATAMGDARQVVTTADIFASNGMLLVAKGARVDSRQFERLTCHRLAAPIDGMLTAEHAVGPHELALEADRIIEHDEVYRRILSRAGDPGRLKYSLNNLKLPPAAQFRLTVMREQRSDIYQHGLRAAMIAFAIAHRRNLGADECNGALQAALFHDVGEMHTDPGLLNPEHAITTAERRFVHVHPITGYVLLRNMEGFTAPTVQAILQHHERLDGSGYPYGLDGARIGRLGRLVAIADVAQAVIKRYPLPRVDILFRINQRRFDSTLTDTLRDLLHVGRADLRTPPNEEAAAAQANHLAALLQAWHRMRKPLAAPVEGALTFLAERMANLRSLVLQAGFDPDNMTALLELARDDAGMQAELCSLLDEMDWLMADIAHEIERRSPELAGLSQGILKDLLGQLRQ